MDTAKLAELQANLTIVVTVANVFLVLLTALYVYLTRQLVAEARAARDPSVSVDLEFPDRMGRIIISNSGQSAAKNIRFAVDDSIPWTTRDKESGFASVAVIKEGISYLPPGRTLKYYAGVLDHKRAEEEGGAVRVCVNYETEGGTQYKQEYLIDVSQYVNVLLESFRDPNREVANAIREAERQRQSHDQASGMRPPFGFLGTKVCPACCSRIPLEAKKCKDCGEWVPEDKAEDKAEDRAASGPVNAGS